MTMRGILLGYGCIPGPVSFRIDPVVIKRHLLYWDRIDWPYLDMFGLIHNLNADFFEQVKGVLKKFNLPENGDAFKEAVDYIIRNPSKKQIGAVMYGHDDLFVLAEQEFLVHSIVTNPPVPNVGEAVARYQRAQFEILDSRNKADGEIWSLGQTSQKLVLLPEEVVTRKVVEIELYRCLPVPEDTVPVAEILEFRLRRDAELRRFRAAMDELVFKVAETLRPPDVKDRVLDSFRQTLADLETVIHEAPFVSKVVTSKAVVDIALEAMSTAAGVAGGALTLGMPPDQALVVGGSAGLLKVLVGRAPAPPQLPSKLKDFAYLQYADKELRMRNLDASSPGPPEKET